MGFITLKNASAHSALVSLLKEEDNSDVVHVRCVGPVLNIVVQVILDDVYFSPTFSKLRKTVRWFRASHGRVTKLQRAVIFDGKEYGKEISLDTPTRWGSAYDMLSVVLQYREDIQAIISAQQNEYSRLRRDGNIPRGAKNVEDKLLADSEWEIA